MQQVPQKLSNNRPKKKNSETTSRKMVLLTPSQKVANSFFNYSSRGPLWRIWQTYGSPRVISCSYLISSWIKKHLGAAVGLDIENMKKENDELKKANAELQQKVEELTKKVNFFLYH